MVAKIKAPAVPGSPRFGAWFRRPLKTSRSPLVVLSMHGTSVKVLAAAGTPEKPRIALAKIPMPSDGSEEEAVTQLRQFLSAHGIKEPRIIISCASSFVRAAQLKLPSTDMKELRTMVDLEVEKSSPEAKDETLSYFSLLASRPDGYSQVFVVTCHADIARKGVSLVERLGGRLTHVTCDLDGFLIWLREIKKGKKDADAWIILVDVDNDCTTLTVLHKKKVILHRCLSFGAQDPACEDKLSQEFERSVALLKEEEGEVSISEVLLSGMVPESCVFLADKTGTPLPVRVVPAFPGAELSQESSQALTSGSFTALAGFMSGVPQGDLTPPALRIRRRFEQRIRAGTILMGQLLFAAVILGGVFLKGLHEKTGHEKALFAKVKATEKDAKDVETSLMILKEIKKRMNDRGNLLQSILDMSKATPAPVQWEALTYTKGEGVELKGFSQEMPEVFKMVTELEKSGLFLQAKPQHVAKRKTENQSDVTAFEINAPFFQAAEDHASHS
ncbi:MAG TPA: PilN domain-containing protein [Verrucomicrobiae bacterium]|jgi:Tfp pilus assembly protein PilN|nr:PilN domain-containing protein [Verrucomicrobiae bacterium]